MLNLLKNFFPSYNEKEILKYQKFVEKINQNEKKFFDFSEKNFQEETEKLKEKIKNSSEEKISDEFLIESLSLAKAWCRFLANQKFEYKKWESVEIWKMVPYDVQLIWAMILNEWRIAEMKTWEWKTLVAALSLYVNALSWKWAHLVTVNQYLAERDASEMWILFNLLWMKVWVISQEQNHSQKKKLIILI